MLSIVIHTKQILILALLGSRLPACSLYARDVSSNRLHSELVLYLVRTLFFCEIIFYAYSAHLKVAQYTTALAAHDAAVANLGRSGVAVHLRKLQLSLSADSRGERRISDHVSQRLSVASSVSSCFNSASRLVLERLPRIVGAVRTAQVRIARKSCAWCGRESFECCRNIPNRAFSLGT